MGDLLSSILSSMDAPKSRTVPPSAPPKQQLDELMAWRRSENERVVQHFLSSRVSSSAAAPQPQQQQQQQQRKEEEAEPLAATAARVAACRSLLQSLRRACAAEGLSSEPKGALLRWLLTQKMLESAAAAASADPVLPTAPASDPGLVHELRKLGLSQAAVARVESALRQACLDAVARVKKAASAGAGAGDVVVAVAGDGDGAAVSLSAAGLTVVVSARKRTQLEAMWRRLHDGGDDGRACFDQAVFRLLGRYEALPGGDSYQAALPPRVFALLRDRLGVAHECFASPLNRSAEIAAFSSAFPDTDAAFGSSGDFFAIAGDESRMASTGGSFEANPPFLEETMLALARVLQRWLDLCKEPLSFVVVFPLWDDTPALEILSADARCRRKLRLSRRDHVYLSGAQHKPSKSPELINYSETLVLVLQNDLGHKKWPFDDALEAAFRSAFARPLPAAEDHPAAKKQRMMAGIS